MPKRMIDPKHDPDPYICQRCGQYFGYLDLQGNPQCECGSEHFWPVTERMEQTVLLIILGLGSRYRSAEAKVDSLRGFMQQAIDEPEDAQATVGMSYTDGFEACARYVLERLQ